jgi:CBS domain-containing protein
MTEERKRRGSLSDLSESHHRRSESRKSLDFSIKGSNGQFAALFKAHTVDELKTSKAIIELDTSIHTPMTGFQLLLKNDILSAPVWDPTSSSYIGMLDIRDLVSSIMFAVKTQQRARSKSTNVEVQLPLGGGSPEAAAVINEEIRSEAAFHAKDWEEHAEKSIKKKFSGTEPRLEYLARRNPFQTIKNDATLYEAAKQLSGRTHRLAVLGEDKRVAKIVSQSQLVHFLSEHLNDVAENASQTIEETSLGLRDVISARGDRPALEAFLELDNHQLSGVAVVLRDGTIAGNTSSRDLRYFLMDRGALSVNMNLLDYLAAIRQKDVTASDRAPVCSVGPSGTISRIVGLLAATEYHRVYIVDQRHKPIGVVSLTDILKYVTAVNHLPLNVPDARPTRRSVSGDALSVTGSSPRGRLSLGSGEPSPRRRHSPSPSPPKK